jgi:hypothetical protein
MSESGPERWLKKIEITMIAEVRYVVKKEMETKNGEVRGPGAGWSGERVELSKCDRGASYGGGYGGGGCHEQIMGKNGPFSRGERKRVGKNDSHSCSHTSGRK